MQQSFQKMKYARQLISDYDTIIGNMIDFNSLWDQFWEGDSSIIGDLLTCHLILEFHFTNWLVASNPGLPSIGKMRLPFSQKITLADGVDNSIQWLLPGLKYINKTRNIFAHDIFVDLTSIDLDPLKKIVWPWHNATGKPQNDGIQLIKDFTLMASGLLYGQAKSIERYANGGGIVAYHRWIKTAMQSDEN